MGRPSVRGRVVRRLALWGIGLLAIAVAGAIVSGTVNTVSEIMFSLTLCSSRKHNTATPLAAIKLFLFKIGMLSLAAAFLPIPGTAHAQDIQGLIAGVQGLLRRTPARAELLRANRVSRRVSLVSVYSAAMLAVGVTFMPVITAFFIPRRSLFPRLPLAVWPPPCSPDSDWCEVVLLVLESSLVSTLSVVYGCFTTIHVSLLVYLAELLRVPAAILHSTLQAASLRRPFCTVGHYVDKQDKRSNAIEDTQTDREVNSMISYHHDVIRLIDQYNECFAGALLLRHSVSILFLPASALLFMTDPSNLQAVGIAVFTLLTMFTFSFWSDKLKAANDDMHWAVYDSGWENLPAQLRTKLCVLLCRANRPIGARGTHIKILTFNSFLQMVRSSYSLLQFLFQLQF